MRAQPNSAALKNASVFGAPELRQRAGRYLPSRYTLIHPIYFSENKHFNIQTASADNTFLYQHHQIQPRFPRRAPAVLAGE